MYDETIMKYCCAKNISDRMKSKKMTVEMLSEETGIAKSSLYRYLSAKGIMDIYQASIVSTVLGCTIGELTDTSLMEYDIYGDDGYIDPDDYVYDGEEGGAKD